VIAKLQGALLVTADHGNADEMFEVDPKTKQPKLDKQSRPAPKTSHTLNPVPFYVYAPSLPSLRIDTGVAHPRLANIAATVLQLLGYKAPADYEHALLNLG
jgi:2,3-bisphosphoglycerate-independent phosphoglycerate mutase